MVKDPTVIQAKRFGVYSCDGSTTLLGAARQMAEEDISALVVLDQDGFLAGLISRVDLLRAKMETGDWSSQLVERWMSTDVATVNPTDHLSQVTRLLLDRKIHRVVAVEKVAGKARPIGVISTADLIYHLVKFGPESI